MCKNFIADLAFSMEYDLSDSANFATFLKIQVKQQCRKIFQGRMLIAWVGCCKKEYDLSGKNGQFASRMEKIESKPCTWNT